MYSLLNLDLITVGVAVAANVILGSVVFFKDTKNATGRLFLLQTLILSIWSVVNYFTYKISNITVALWLERSVLFFAVPNSIVFLLLMHTFPAQNIQIKKSSFYLLIISALFVMCLTLSPFVFSAVTIIPGVPAPQPVVAPGIIVFALEAVLSIPLAIYFLVIKFNSADGIQRNQLKFLLIGVTVMFISIVIFDFIFPTFFQNTRFIPLSALFTLPFVCFTFYAIYKHGLLKIKVISTEILTFVLCIVSLIEILFSNTVTEVLIRSAVFILILIFGVSLIKSVVHEVQQRERIQALADDLAKANENQIALIHFITHQVKGFFTKSRNIFSLMLEGEAGDMTPEAKHFITEGFESDTKGVAMVQDVLNAANIRSGIVKYTMEPFDVSTLIAAMVIEYRKVAEDKGLTIDFTCWGKEPDGSTGAVPNCLIDMKGHANYTVNGDEEQLRHVFKNLIENALHYTPKGSIAVRLRQSVAESSVDPSVPHSIIFSVKDSGVGLTDEDKALLFTQGGRGKDSVKVNVESTGYGLFIAKGIVDAHHGRIWAESEGRDKGATFFVELPGVVVR